MNIDYYFKFENLCGSFLGIKVGYESTGANSIHPQYSMLAVNMENIEDWKGFDDRFEFLPIAYRDFKTSFAGHANGAKNFFGKYAYVGYVGFLLDKQNPAEARLCILPCHEKTKEELPQIAALCGAGFSFLFRMQADTNKTFLGIQSYQLKDEVKAGTPKVETTYVVSYSNLRVRVPGQPTKTRFPNKYKPLLSAHLAQPGSLTFEQRMGLTGFTRSISEVLWDNPLCPIVPASSCLEHSIISMSSIQHEGIRHWCNQILIELLVCDKELGRQLGALFYVNNPKD